MQSPRTTPRSHRIYSFIRRLKHNQKQDWLCVCVAVVVIVVIGGCLFYAKLLLSLHCSLVDMESWRVPFTLRPLPPSSSQPLAMNYNFILKSINGVKLFTVIVNFCTHNNRNMVNWCVVRVHTEQICRGCVRRMHGNCLFEFACE